MSSKGSVRKAAGKVRITGQLIEAATGAQIWAEHFEGDLSDIFALQDMVTESRCWPFDQNCFKEN